MIVVRARIAFAKRKRGDRWRVTPREAARLERAGLAIRLQPGTPTRLRPAIEPVPLGGSWWLVGSMKVQGRERAEALASELS